MHFILLTHSRELSKNTATGPLVKQLMQDQCEIIEWSRTQPDPRLTDLLDSSKTLLIYPETDKSIEPLQGQDDISEFNTFIILDGTWQEARKIYNRSPYLYSLKHYSLDISIPSRYQLRRNQKSMGLCTAEVAIALLQQKGEAQQANQLESQFFAFNSGLESPQE